MKNRSFFSPGKISRPLTTIDSWMNPCIHTVTSKLDGNNITVSWTRRAEQALSDLNEPLLAEMQLYFSCMVLKKVLFHHNQTRDSAQAINARLNIAFSLVQSDACNPEEFAAQHPGKKTLDSAGALRMHPRELKIDYKKNQWSGEFLI